MSEIEKMYENCNIKPKQEGYCDWDSDCPYPDIIDNGCGDECPYWKYENEAKYPPFTAEKQLELIKWLIREKYLIGRYIESYYELFTNSMISYNSKNECFEKSLAGLINNLWQDLAEEERKQIKEILE